MQTEFEYCEGLSQEELLARMRENPLFRLFPAAQVYVERMTVKPEIPEPEPETEPPTKRCDFCFGSGQIALTLRPCSHCTDGRVPV